MITKLGLSVIAATLIVFSVAVIAFEAPPYAMADIVIIGELHQNPEHHANQAQILDELRPKAVVFEMLTPQEAARLAETARQVEALQDATQGFHWNDMAGYHEVLAASPVIIGTAVPREEARAAFENGAAAEFAGDAVAYGLTDELPTQELVQRKSIQFSAHCQAMPMDMMGGIVEAQRLRDATFARSVLEALDQYGAPIVLITGNGHARKDWGVPRFLARIAPDLEVFSIGQNVKTGPDTPFDLVLTSPESPQAQDPCDALR